ncbi:MAG: heme utilization cystosolic carrier protein HutX [Pseudomonadota bacterium]
MTEQTAVLKEKLAQNPDGILEVFAKEHGLSLADTIRCLPEEMWREHPGDCFENVITNITDWGKVTAIANTGDMIFEVEGSFPKGTFGHGYYNLKKTEGGFSGHIKADACNAVFFLQRPFFSKQTASVNFMNGDGNCYLKIFLGRDADGEIKSDQLEKFNDLANW